MKIVKKDVLKEICDLLVLKARYQKVVVCYDDSADAVLVEKIKEKVGKRMIIIDFYYNNNRIELEKILQDGVRVVVYNVKINNYLKARMDNDFLIKVFIPTGNFILPYVIERDGFFCDNLLVYKDCLDFLTIILLYDAGLTKLWADVQMQQNVDLEIFKQIDNVVNCGSGDLIRIVNYLSPYFDVSVEEECIPYYIYLKLCYVCKMLERFKFNEESVIDFYKLKLTGDEINKAYQVLVKSEMVDYLKMYCDKMLRVVDALLQRVKILIKKYFKNKINIEKIDLKIKENSKNLKIDNLLYISYIFNVFD